MDTHEDGTRIALIGIIVEDASAVEPLNGILHEYAEFVIGRMGVPYRAKGIHLISVMVDAPADRVSALAGKLGMVDGLSVKTVYSKKEV